LTSLKTGKALKVSNYFIYDKDRFLVDYFEFKEGRLKCHYSLRGNVLIKKFLQEDEGGEVYSKAKIEFENVPLKLEYMRIHGEPRIVATKTEGAMQHPTIVSEIRMEDDIALKYSVKSEIIDKILKNSK
jgi:hypothetical protein